MAPVPSSLWLRSCPPPTALVCPEVAPALPVLGAAPQGFRGAAGVAGQEGCGVGDLGDRAHPGTGSRPPRRAHHRSEENPRAASAGRCGQPCLPACTEPRARCCRCCRHRAGLSPAGCPGSLLLHPQRFQAPQAASRGKGAPGKPSGQDALLSSPPLLPSSPPAGPALPLPTAAP